MSSLLQPMSKKEKAAVAAAKAAAISESSSFPYLGQALRLVLKDGRILEGFLAVVDGRGNLILVEAAETRNYSIVDEKGTEVSKEPVVKAVGFVSVNMRDITALSKIIVPQQQQQEEEEATDAKKKK